MTNKMLTATQYYRQNVTMLNSCDLYFIPFAALVCSLLLIIVIQSNLSKWMLLKWIPGNPLNWISLA